MKTIVIKEQAKCKEYQTAVANKERELAEVIAAAAGITTAVLGFHFVCCAGSSADTPPFPVVWRVQLSATVVGLNKELEQLVAQTSVTVRADEEKVVEMSHDIASEQRAIAQLKEQVRRTLCRLPHTLLLLHTHIHIHMHTLLHIHTHAHTTMDELVVLIVDRFPRVCAYCLVVRRRQLRQKSARLKQVESERNKLRESRAELDATLSQLTESLEKRAVALKKVSRDRQEAEYEASKWRQEAARLEQLLHSDGGHRRSASPSHRYHATHSNQVTSHGGSRAGHDGASAAAGSHRERERDSSRCTLHTHHPSTLVSFLPLLSLPLRHSHPHSLTHSLTHSLRCSTLSSRSVGTPRIYPSNGLSPCVCRITR